MKKYLLIEIDDSIYERISNLPKGSILSLENNGKSVYMIIISSNNHTVSVYWADKKSGEIIVISFTQSGFISEYNILYAYYSAHEINYESVNLNENLSLKSCPCGGNVVYFVR